MKTLLVADDLPFLGRMPWAIGREGRGLGGQAADRCQEDDFTADFHPWRAHF